MTSHSPHAPYKPRKKRFTLNDDDRAEHVQNHQDLYSWFLSSRMTMREFVKENRDELTRIIKERVGQE